jgi:glycosyl-4,4'-diaponeurosporenoate acyltransferase
MLIDLPFSVVVTLNIIGWPIIQLSLAWICTNLPLRWFTPPRSFAWEHQGRCYEKIFAIRTWKDRLPDGASWLSNGFSKGKLADKTPEYLSRFICETWRGELCHWLAIALTPIFFLWNPLWADLVMFTYALLANLPCILAQRYNRVRLLHTLHRQSAKAQQ